MTLYVSYQLEGGTEDWKIAHATQDLTDEKPTFVTILACDTLLAKGSPKTMLDDAKYLGPMYFDLDSNDEVGLAIDGAKSLWRKLQTYGLTEQDVEIHLSGKKGLHILIPSTVFMEKQHAVSKLPAIYKELAFNLAVDTVDFSVYSGRRGRMLRTHHNQRENGNYKVQISAHELENLDEAGYQAICKVKRGKLALTPTYRPKFAILYEGIRQKVAALKRVKTKPVDANTLRRHLPTVKRLMDADNIREGVGFNKIAIQLGLYAHEAKLTEDDFVSQCDGLLRKHNSDSYRYNSVRKREAELRRMYLYLEDGVGYDYSIMPIQSMLSTEEVESVNEDGETVETTEVVEDSSGLYCKGANYFVMGDQGDKHIMDAKFRDTTILHIIENEQISCIVANIQVGEKVSKINLERSDFISSTNLHRAVSLFGASFTGTDVHARYIYTHMLKESKVNGKTVYVTEQEGLNILCMPFSPIKEAREPFVVWSDASGVKLPQHLVELGLDVRFVGYPTPEGVVKTDLAQARNYLEFCKTPGERQRMLTMLRGMLTCQDPISLSKLLGWMGACFSSQLFRHAYGNFPILHVNGAAGSGKSEMVENMMKMFFSNGEASILNPSSSVFAIQTNISGSASIPTVVDEYKPHEMNVIQHNALKSMFRSCYNGHTVSKGGGSRTKDSFSALSTTKLTGPVAFIAEAIEQETALLERCVLVTLRRPAGMLSARYRPRFVQFKENSDCMTQIGLHLAAKIIEGGSIDKLKAEFAPIYKEAREAYMLQDGDLDTDKYTQEQLLQKSSGLSERVVYNHAVAKYGLRQIRDTVLLMYPEHTEEFQGLFSDLESAIYHKIDTIVANTMPEYCKILMVMSDMTRFDDSYGIKLTSKVEYEHGNVGDTATLILVGRLVFSKYRQYCRIIGQTPLFAQEGQFIHAIKDSHLYIESGKGTSKLTQETMVLNYEQLLRLGVPAFSK